MIVDRSRVARALRALDALVEANPRLRAPSARRRLAAALRLVATGPATDAPEPTDAPTRRTGHGNGNP